MNEVKTEMILDSQENRPVVIVCAADDRYAMPLAVMARSVLENLSGEREVKFFILDGGIKDINKSKILKTLSSKKCEVNFLLDPSSYFDQNFQDAVQYTITEGQAKKHLSIPAYYRLLIADLLPAELKKAIYLDCDLVVNTDIGKLWDLDLKDDYLLAVPDMWIQSVSAHNGLLNYRELSIDPKLKYFNSGVVVINIEQWRLGDILEKSIQYIQRNREYIRFADQDILNALLADKWSEIDPRWNVTPGIYEYGCWQDSHFTEDVYNQLIHDPYIIHFAAGDKPWNSKNALMKEHFFRYVDMTEWSGWRFTEWKQFQNGLAYKFKKLKKIISN